MTIEKECLPQVRWHYFECKVWHRDISGFAASGGAFVMFYDAAPRSLRQYPGYRVSAESVIDYHGTMIMQKRQPWQNQVNKMLSHIVEV